MFITVWRKANQKQKQCLDVTNTQQQEQVNSHHTAHKTGTDKAYRIIGSDTVPKPTAILGGNIELYYPWWEHTVCGVTGIVKFHNGVCGVFGLDLCCQGGGAGSVACGIALGGVAVSWQVNCYCSDVAI